jgi:hypothetical protein
MEAGFFLNELREPGIHRIRGSPCKMGFFPARLPPVKTRTFPCDGKMQFNQTANIRLARIK